MSEPPLDWVLTIVLAQCAVVLVVAAAMKIWRKK